MKKSKIIGLSLGFTALAAVAVTTPFVVTSCSASNTLGVTLLEDKKENLHFIDVTGSTIQQNDVSVKGNSATIYIRDEKGPNLSFKLNNKALKFNEVEGYTISTIIWNNVKENQDYSLTNEQDGSVKFTIKQDISTLYHQLMQVNLEGTVKLIPTKDNQNQEEITKNFNVKLYITRGYYDLENGEHVLPADL